MSGIYEAAHPALAYRRQMEVYRRGDTASRQHQHQQQQQDLCVVSFGRREMKRVPPKKSIGRALLLRVSNAYQNMEKVLLHPPCCLCFFSVFLNFVKV